MGKKGVKNKGITKDIEVSEPGVVPEGKPGEEEGEMRKSATSVGKQDKSAISVEKVVATSLETFGGPQETVGEDGDKDRTRSPKKKKVSKKEKLQFAKKKVSKESRAEKKSSRKGRKKKGGKKEKSLVVDKREEEITETPLKGTLAERKEKGGSKKKKVKPPPIEALEAKPKTKSTKKLKNGPTKATSSGDEHFDASSSSSGSKEEDETEMGKGSTSRQVSGGEGILDAVNIETKTKIGSKKKEKKSKVKAKTKKMKEEKTKKKKEEREMTLQEPEVDIMAEINKMKALAEAEASGLVIESESEITTEKKRKRPKTKKKGPKKKLSKKEKQRLAAELAEKARIEAEEAAARAAEEERIRLEEEKKAAIEKEKREIVEQQIRMEQLQSAHDFINDLVKYNTRLGEEAKELMEWNLYVNCGKLPNPSKCDDMNTYLHLWERSIENTTMKEAANRTKDVLELLGDLDNLIDTATSKELELVDNWKWLRLLFREHQAKSLDVATYRLLRDVEKNLNRIDIARANYRYKDENLIMCLWLRVQLPTPLPNPRKPPPPRIEIDFKEMKMQVQFPVSIDCYKMAIRAMYVTYNHLSDLCVTYQKPPIPEQYEIDLYNYTKKEWRDKLRYKYDHRVIVQPLPPPPRDDNNEEEEPKEEPVEIEIGPDDDVPLVPYRKLTPTASEFVIGLEESLYSEIKSGLMKHVADDEINLRKFSIIGGVFSLDLLYQPPQPQDFVTMEMQLTSLYVPKQLEKVPFYKTYSPPEPPEPGVTRLPEEIEEELKKQEEELDRLISVTLTWPDYVIYLELPVVCYWEETRGVWTKRDVYDLKHNEEKGELTFRTGRFGIFGLAAYRYANLPYQAWEIRPEADGSVTLQIIAAILMVEFNVNRNGLITLSQLQNSPNNAMQNIIGTFFKLPKLIRIMQDCGVDLFPAFDAFCYVDGTCEKHWPMEKHLYFNMAQLATCFNFAWSRWNLPAGRRDVVMQMREYNVEKVKQKNHSMLHVTPLKAILVDCTEVSQTFNEEGVEFMKFYADLFYLMKGTCSMAVRNQVSGAPKEQVYSLHQLLVATRIVSFS